MIGAEVNKLANTLVYEWEAWKGFLVSHLVSDYCRMTANYDDEISDIERFLTPNIKAVLFQINLSKQGEYPFQRKEIIHYLKKKNITVLNEYVTDISKSALHLLLERAGIQHLRVTEKDDDNMLVMVKSDLNWGGEVEQRLSSAIRRKIYGEISRSITAFDQYYVCPKKTLPKQVWKDKSVVVERYVTNRNDSFFRVYRFGNSVVVVNAHSQDVIKKIGGDSRDVNFFYHVKDITSQVSDLPKPLETLLRQFMMNTQIDYFCLDIVHGKAYSGAEVGEDEFYIIDLNVTPYSGIQTQEPRAAEFLRDGAKSSLDEKRQNQ